MQAILLQMLSALVGAVVVYIFGIRQLSVQLRNSFVERQLSEFYSPIAGYRKRIRTKSELRAKISSAAQEVWQETCARYSDPEKMARRSDELFAPYKRIIEYDNQQFREELLPLYRKMLDVFTEKYWLRSIGLPIKILALTTRGSWSLWRSGTVSSQTRCRER